MTSKFINWKKVFNLLILGFGIVNIISLMLVGASSNHPDIEELYKASCIGLIISFPLFLISSIVRGFLEGYEEEKKESDDFYTNLFYDVVSTGKSSAELEKKLRKYSGVSNSDLKDYKLKLQAVSGKISRHLEQVDLSFLDELINLYVGKFVKITSPDKICFVLCRKIQMCNSDSIFLVGKSVQSDSFGLILGRDEWVKLPDDPSRITIYESKEDVINDVRPLIESLIEKM